jgi:aryl-alcohol dehydrogenase-like predicted oxidoreductase
VRTARLLRVDGQPVKRLGLGGNSETRPQWVDRAYRLGIDYFFFYSQAFEGMVDGVRALCQRHRDDVFVATGTENRDFESLTGSRDEALRTLGTPFLDIFYLEYISPADELSRVSDALAEVVRWKEAGLIRYVGVSVHDRELASDLAERPDVDVLMHRYNMAHRKSEVSVLARAEAADVPVVAFTCTRWGSLLRDHPGWSGNPPTPADCYQFAFSHPAIDLALTAPCSIRELEENVEALKRGDMSEAERDAWCAYGDLVYGDGTDAFETRWP